MIGDMTVMTVAVMTTTVTYSTTIGRIPVHRDKVLEEAMVAIQAAEAEAATAEETIHPMVELMKSPASVSS